MILLRGRVKRGKGKAFKEFQPLEKILEFMQKIYIIVSAVDGCSRTS